MTEEPMMVRPVRTYLDGHDLKQPGDEPYMVGPYRAEDLIRRGLAEPAPAATAPAEGSGLAPAGAVEAGPAVDLANSDQPKPQARGRSSRT